MNIEKYINILYWETEGVLRKCRLIFLGTSHWQGKRVVFTECLERAIGYRSRAERTSFATEHLWMIRGGHLGAILGHYLWQIPFVYYSKTCVYSEVSERITLWFWGPGLPDPWREENPRYIFWTIQLCQHACFVAEHSSLSRTPCVGHVRKRSCFSNSTDLASCFHFTLPACWPERRSDERFGAAPSSDWAGSSNSLCQPAPSTEFGLLEPRQNHFIRNCSYFVAISVPLPPYHNITCFSYSHVD